MMQSDAMIQPVLAHRVAHDVRSPLTAIQMCADLLARDEPEPRARYVRMIAQQARAINWAMESLVALADAQERVAEGAEADLFQCLDLCCNELIPILSLKNITLLQPEITDHFNVVGDAGHLALAFRSCGEALQGITADDGQMNITIESIQSNYLEIQFKVMPLIPGVNNENVFSIPRTGLVSARYIIETAGGGLSMQYENKNSIVVKIGLIPH